MKILVVCQYFYPENFVISNICERLVSYGHDVTVLTGKPNYGYGEIIPEYKKMKYQEYKGIKIHRVNLVARKKSRFSIIKNYLSFWSNSKKWVRKCKEKYDIVYSMSLSPVTILSAGNLYKKKYHVPHVAHCVDLWPESTIVTHAVKKGSLVYRFLYKWSKKLYNNVDKILIGSPSFEEYFRDVLKLDKPMEFVPQPSLVEKSDIAPIELEKDYFHLLYCGNLGLIQQIPLITEAMKELKEEKIKFHVIGMGPLSTKLEKDIKDYGLEDRVIYHGPIPALQASAYFKAVDALYVGLKDEGTVGKTIPNKLVMSMAFAKPILGLIEGDGKAILEQSKGGIFAEQNATSLKEAILKMSNLSKEERKTLGDNNYAFYQENLTLDKVSRKIEKSLLETK